MRVSAKTLETSVHVLNYYTNHKVKISFTQGCGVYLTIDDKEYKKQIGENTFTGITNKKAYEILNSYNQEVMKGYEKSR